MEIDLTAMVWCDGLIAVFCHTSKMAASARPVGQWTFPQVVELEWIFSLFYFCTGFECAMDLDDFYLKGSYVCLCVTRQGPFQPVLEDCWVSSWTGM